MPLSLSLSIVCDVCCCLPGSWERLVSASLSMCVSALYSACTISVVCTSVALFVLCVCFMCV